MNRRRAVFLALLVVSTANAGVAATDFTTRLGNVDAIDRLKDRIEVDLTRSTFQDQRLTLTMRFSNPTGTDLRILGARLRVSTESNPTVASGTAAGFEPVDLPAGGTTTVEFAVQVAPDRTDGLTAALEGNATGSLRIGVLIGETRFELLRRYPLGDATRTTAAAIAVPGGA